jgi:hypothetical protein
MHLSTLVPLPQEPKVLSQDVFRPWTSKHLHYNNWKKKKNEAYITLLLDLEVTAKVVNHILALRAWQASPKVWWISCWHLLGGLSSCLSMHTHIYEHQSNVYSAGEQTMLRISSHLNHLHRQNNIARHVDKWHSRAIHTQHSLHWDM